MEKEAYKKSVLEYEDVQEAVRYAHEQGLEQGREERTRQLARNMLDKGFAPALVSEITSMAVEEVMAMNEGNN